MLSSCIRASLRETRLFAVAGALFCLNGHSIAAATPPGQVAYPKTSTASDRFVVLTEPVKLKVPYGETVLPAGIKLVVISSDADSVRVKYMGEIETIPRGATRFEASVEDRPDPAPLTAPAPPTSSAPSSSAELQVSLQPGYDSRMQGGDMSMRELQLLLSPHCNRAVDLSGAGTEIYNGVTYLMHSEEAAVTLGLPHTIPSRVPLASPGFPKSSLYYIGYDGAFEGRFTRLYLVSDTANKVVAIQLVDEHPKGRWKSAASLAAASWNTYDFITGRLRASDSMRVQAVSKRQGKIVSIEAQMYQRVRWRVGGKNVDRYEEQEDTKMFIPIPFARLILHCAQIGLSKS